RSGRVSFLYGRLEALDEKDPVGQIGQLVVQDAVFDACPQPKPLERFLKPVCEVYDRLLEVIDEFARFVRRQSDDAFKSAFDHDSDHMVGDEAGGVLARPSGPAAYQARRSAFDVPDPLEPLLSVRDAMQ